jgi:hypothetical protein
LIKISNSVSGTPRALTVPSVPIITNVVAYRDWQQSEPNGVISITFTQDSNGGSPITHYEHLVAGSWVAFSPVQNTSPIIYSRLNYNYMYTMIIRAVNNIGNSEQSAEFTIKVPFE